jgi:hypothetical protein
MPGLIDLHGHPEYNVSAAGEPPRSYANRYAWRRSMESPPRSRATASVASRRRWVDRAVVRAPWTDRPLHPFGRGHGRVVW